jgi:uncharacterized protein with HEPN domain
MKSNQTYLLQIIDYIDQIMVYTRDVGFDKFEENGMLQDAVIRKIELIGEAAKRLSIDFWETHRNNLPLAEAVSTRNRLIHQYDEIDIRIVWHTVRKDLPGLREKLIQIIDLDHTL